MDNQNKRIAKNTIYLYFRTILIMIVSLYMSRVVLQTLGVEDYGVYNAVGGVVTLFAIISGALSNAISRYITYGLGKNDDERLNLIFCTGLNIQILISIVIVLLCEVLGVWLLNCKMSIPPERLTAANWVLQCSLLTFVINLISVPYNACIIAHEHMNAYAYISIIDAMLKLSVAFLIIIAPYDKLIVYSILLVVVSLVVRIIYGLYCDHFFKETHYHLVYDKKLFYEMSSFAGWNFFTNGASIINSQGITLLINVYFGVILNTARGIATQVEGAIGQFVNSFTTAVNPQITKSYAQNEKDRMFSLICKGAKFSYLLLLLMIVPIMIETDYILKLWLGTVPEYASLFVRLALVGSMVTTLGYTGYTACMATGNIKTYSIWLTTIGSLVFFSSWILYAVGAPVESAYYAYIVVYILVQIARLIIMRNLLDFPLRLFFREVISRITLPTILAFLPAIFILFIGESILRLLLVIISSLIWVSFLVYVFSLTKNERILISNKLIAIKGKL